MAIRKHVTELALGFYSDDLMILHPSDIGTIDLQPAETVALAESCHIYLIVTRPRGLFAPGSLDISDEQTTGQLRFVIDGVPQETVFSFHGPRFEGQLEISEYPHRELVFKRDGKRISSLPAHLCSLMCDRLADMSLRDLEVVYVGMSYADGTRSAKDRLASHATLQQVLADLSADAPDFEALVVLVNYAAPQTFISMDGRDKSLKIENDRDVVADLRKQIDLVTEDLQIALIEASLIRYFQPSYNEKYKHRFPHPTQRILKEIYEIDFGALTVEINTESINARLYSQVREAGYHHICSVDLHDPQERRSFFNLMNLPNGSDAADHSGPIF